MGSGIGRRQAGMLGAAILAGCAAPSTAFPQAGGAPGGVVLPVPMPCADRPGDVVGLVLEGQGAPAETVVLFGQAFRPGDVPRGATLAARLPDGRPLRMQFDVTVRHPDGSARHGLVALETPRLRRGARAGVVLSRGAAGTAQPAALDMAVALAGRQAVVELAPAGAGEPWRADLLALLAAAPRESRATPWQSGPLVVQDRVSVPVPPAAIGGATSMRLVADLAVLADGTLWVDVWLRNDAAMRAGGGAAAYALRVLLDGREALRAERVQQTQYQCWGRLLGAAPGGTPAPIAPLVRHDAAYLAETGAIARYDLSTGVAAHLLADMERALAARDWQAPLGARGITRFMPTGGGRADLGQATAWQAAWLITGDPRAAAFCTGQAEAAGAVPWHLWDPEGGIERRGGWMDAQRWPRLWTDPRGGRPPGTLLQPIPMEESGWTPSVSHQPALGFVPYLLTGRRAFLDELQAQAAWSVLAQMPGLRSPEGTPPNTDGLIVVRALQVRSSAWAIRDVDNAAWISPDGDANQPYLRLVAARNWRWLRAQLPAWTRAQGEPHGWIMPDENDVSVLAPWQQDYFATSAAAAARRGNEDARAVLAWMAKFLVGRFGAGERGFSPHDGVAYFIAVGPQPGTWRTLYRSWAEIGEQTRARGLSNGTDWTKTGGTYGRLAMQSLAMLHEVLGLEEARRAQAWLSAGRDLDAAAYAREPAFNVVSRGMPRVPGRAASCTPARGV